MYIYIFGSICRGEIDKQSDIDMLAIIDEQKQQEQFDKNKFSIYTINRLTDLWKEGNPFAWHLFLESKLVYSDNSQDIFKKWGEPNQYINMKSDLDKFYSLFLKAVESLKTSADSQIFDLSMIFLSIRNFSSCYSLGQLNDYNFSRYSALNLKSNKLAISKSCFAILERARLLSTRGIGKLMTKNEIDIVFAELNIIENWFKKISTNV